MDLPSYDYNWKNKDKFPLGTEDNLWWLQYRRWMKEQGIVKELHFEVNPIYLGQ